MADWAGHPAGYMELAYDSDTMIDGRQYNIIRYFGSSKLSGQMVCSRPKAANSHDISVLADGLYVVEVSINGQLIRQKVLVRH